MIFKMAIRNVVRQKRRSILTGLAMTVGFVLMSISLGFNYGGYGRMIELFTRSSTGHIQIHYKDYLDNPSLFKTLNNPGEIEKVLQQTPFIKGFAPRVYGGALTFLQNKSTGVSLVGIDPQKESKLTTIKKRIIQGSYLESPDAHQVLIGKSVASVLKATLGDELILISQGADGSIANDLFKVVGIMGEVDAYKIFLPISVMQEYLSLQTKVHEYTTIIADYQQSTVFADKLKKKLPNLDIRPWQIVEKDFYKAMKADEQGNFFFLGIIMFIVALGVLNTVLMSVLERTKEFGILKAIGSRPMHIYNLIVIESQILAFTSIVLGTILAIFANWWFIHNGIVFDPPISYGGVMFDEMVSTLELKVFIAPAVTVSVTSLVVSIFPGIRAARIVPVKAMRVV
ncbi:MAG: ABC transporter permease [Bacteriovoracaceae bacterium]|nr:ABC transporter permease [Bacteriovoracaceae bacterium]